MGTHRENVRLQDAAFQQAIEDYRQVVIQAQGEVELALIGYFKSLQQQAALQQAADAAQRAVDVSTEQYQDGPVDYNTVVSTLRVLVGNRISLPPFRAPWPSISSGCTSRSGAGGRAAERERRRSSPRQTKEEMRARGKYWGVPRKDK